jgi:hypothetical protein
MDKILKWTPFGVPRAVQVEEALRPAQDRPGAHVMIFANIFRKEMAEMSWQHGLLGIIFACEGKGREIESRQDGEN